MVFRRFKRRPNRRVMRKRPMRRLRAPKGAPGVVMKRRQIVMKRVFAKLPYESGNIGGTGNFRVYQFRANSIFDPDYTGVGHQPRGHDQYANFFRTYRVHAVLVEVFVENNTAFSQSLVAIYPHKSASYPLDVTAIMESPDIKYRVMNDEKPLVFRKYVTMASLFGKRKSVINSDLDYTAAFGTNPEVQGYISVILANMAGASGDISYVARVKLTYYTEMTDPVLLTES